MTNFYKITNADELSNIFEMTQDKLIILMFYTKINQQCKRASIYFEKIAAMNSSSVFCVVDMDEFQGKSRYVNNVNNMPKFELFYQGNSIGTQSTCDEKEIENLVHNGQRYLITQYNMKSNSSNQIGMQNQMPFNNMQLQQMQQQLLSNAQMQNPSYYQYLVQNPIALQNLAQQQLQQMQVRMQPQPQMPLQSFTSTQPAPPTSPFVQYSPQPNTSLPLDQTSTSSNFTIPNMQQMQQMFQIFQMMQQMGVLNLSASPNKVSSQTEQTNKTVVLPNGDEIIPLSDGRYGLVRKKK